MALFHAAHVRSESANSSPEKAVAAALRRIAESLSPGACKGAFDDIEVAGDVAAAEPDANTPAQTGAENEFSNAIAPRR